MNYRTHKSRSSSNFNAELCKHRVQDKENINLHFLRETYASPYQQQRSKNKSNHQKVHPPLPYQKEDSHNYSHLGSSLYNDSSFTMTPKSQTKIRVAFDPLVDTNNNRKTHETSNKSENFIPLFLKKKQNSRYQEDKLNHDTVKSQAGYTGLYKPQQKDNFNKSARLVDDETRNAEKILCPRTSIEKTGLKKEPASYRSSAYSTHDFKGSKLKEKDSTYDFNGSKVRDKETHLDSDYYQTYSKNSKYEQPPKMKDRFYDTMGSRTPLTGYQNRDQKDKLLLRETISTSYKPNDYFSIYNSKSPIKDRRKQENKNSTFQFSSKSRNENERYKTENDSGDQESLDQYDRYFAAKRKKEVKLEKEKDDFSSYSTPKSPYFSKVSQIPASKLTFKKSSNEKSECSSLLDSQAKKNNLNDSDLTSTKNSRFSDSNLSIGKLSIQEFKLGQCKGEGRFGKVFPAKHLKTGFICAIKQVKKESLKYILDQFIQEIKLQLYMNHPNLVKLYGMFSDEDNFYLLMEYMEEGSLYSLLKKKTILREIGFDPIERDIQWSAVYAQRVHSPSRYQT